MVKVVVLVDVQNIYYTTRQIYNASFDYNKFWAEVKLKPFIQRSDGSAKGDWDVGITLDAMEYAKESDVVVLASGDGDFDILVNKIQTDYSASVEVYGVRQLTAVSLIKAASKFLPIESNLLLR